MTQEQKELLLKDLCARLPYGVKILIQDTFKYSIVSCERHVLDVSNFSDIFCFKYKKLDKLMKKAMRERPDDIVIKPYLFPLSSMTDEQKNDLIKNLKSNISVKNEEISFWNLYTANRMDQWKWVFEWCDKNHFDYRGLIPMGLAIDATGLNIY